jgi:hypothetical protein
MGLKFVSHYENRVLTRIFGPKREEVVGGWRKLHSEDASPQTVRVKERRAVSWLGHKET